MGDTNISRMASIVASASERTESESGSHVTSFISGNEAEATAVTSASASTEDNAEEESPYAMHGRGVRMFTGKDQPKDQVITLLINMSQSQHITLRL